MTQTGLPRRPFTEVPPPPGGLDDVRRTARFRRRRRAAVAAGGSSVLAVVVVLVMLLGGGGGVDVLKTVQPAVVPTPAGGSSAASVSAPAKVGQSHASGGGTGVASSQTVPGAGPARGVDGSPASSVVVAQPRLVRSQRTDTSAGQPAFCSEGVNVDYAGLHGAVSHEEEVGWCFAAIARRVANGEQLTVDICRDSTGSGTLSFQTTREVDLTVQRGGKTVWDWARDHPAVSDPHQLSAAAHGCWDWTLVWPDITQSGKSAGHGTYTFLATSMAKELDTVSPVSTTFTL